MEHKNSCENNSNCVDIQIEPKTADIIKLDRTNYAKGFLIDDEWMAGISLENSSGASESGQENLNPLNDTPKYFAFIINHLEGIQISSKYFDQLDDAIRTLNAVPRTWTYQSSSACGSGNCKGESCGAFGSCNKKFYHQAEDVNSKTN